MAEVTRCGSCGTDLLVPVLDMGEQPLAERDTGDWYPLKLMRCSLCTLVQLSHVVDQEVVFPPDHPYAAGNTEALRRHAATIASDLSYDLKAGDLVVDIGANDGTLLYSFLKTAPRLRLAAVEPTRQIEKCRSWNDQLTVYQEFFTAALAKRMVTELGPARLVLANNVLAHVPDPHDFIEGVSTLLDSYGEFITENHDWTSVTDGMQIDTIYHEHLRYYSAASLTRLLEVHGMGVRSVEPVAIHGGSFRVRARNRVGGFTGRAQEVREWLHEVVFAARAKGKIYGVGASTRATPLIHFTGIEGCLDCVCEVPGSQKIGTSIPGTDIQVVDEKCLILDQPPYALLLSWHIARDIIPKLRRMGYKGKFIIPLPEPRIEG